MPSMDQSECLHKDKSILEIIDKIPLFQCVQCTLIFREQNNQDHNSSILYGNYYKNEIVGRFNSIVELVVRSFRFYRALKVIIVSPHARTILDIGSGRGFMLYFLKKYFGFSETVGTQISKPALDYSRNILGLEVYGQDLLQINWQNKQFDVVTMWHVLEHVPNPEQYIIRIHDLLNDNGKLIIEVPNYNSWTRPLAKKYWLGLDLKYHISQFTPQSLMGMLRRHNFSVRLVHTFSLEYSTFISMQGLVSWITKTDHLVFNWLQDGKFSRQLIPHIILFTILLPFCLAVNLILFFSKKGEALFIVANKQPSVP